MRDQGTRDQLVTTAGCFLEERRPNDYVRQWRKRRDDEPTATTGEGDEEGRLTDDGDGGGPTNDDVGKVEGRLVSRRHVLENQVKGRSKVHYNV